jgi:putative ABC transport system permease protein
VRPAPLDRKVLRDLWRTKWQVLAIALLIACGVAVAVMAFSAQRALAQAQARFYAETAFADVFATARRAPLSLVGRLAGIPGVTATDVRLLEAGLMDVPGLARPATAQVISLPAEGAAPLNRVRLARGRLPDPERLDEAVALKTFLDAAHVRLGDRLTAVVGGRALTFTIVGAVLSPEYVYVPAPESFMPDDAHRAILWAPRAALERAEGMSGAFNAVALKLAPGASRPAVLQDLDRLLAPYGGRAAYARAEQPSHAFLAAELKELSTSAEILPPVFLVIAAALVHLVMSRMVDAEREQIGLLKAFGYTRLEAATPYLKTAAAIGVIGAAGGGLAGGLLGAAIVGQYRAYFRFPELTMTFHGPAFAGAAAVAIGAACAGALAATLRAARLSPAVAMQPPRPPAFRAGFWDTLLARGRVDQATRMIVRSLQRFPSRAGLSAVGLAASLALLVGTQFMFDSLDQVVDQAYFRAQRWSEQVAFQDVRSAGVLADLRRMPGVVAGEPTRSVAAKLKAQGREELTRIVGLEPRAALQRPLDAAGAPLALAGRGLVLSEALARKLGVAPGGAVWVEVVDGRAPVARLPVTGLAQDYSGYAAYMPRATLNRLMGDGDVANGAQLMVAADLRPAFYRALERAPFVVGASSRDDTVRAWRQAMTEAFRVNITFYVGFAAAIAFGVAYNLVRISLAERARDLATLHVLGFAHGECAYILAGELAIIVLAATPLGLAGGHLLAHALGAAYSRDELRLPLIITARSYGLSLAAYLAAVAAAALLVVWRVWRLDLVAVLKTRE